VLAAAREGFAADDLAGWVRGVLDAAGILPDDGARAGRLAAEPAAHARVNLSDGAHAALLDLLAPPPLDPARA
jgi:hypothetical protein